MSKTKNTWAARALRVTSVFHVSNKTESTISGPCVPLCLKYPSPAATALKRHIRVFCVAFLSLSGPLDFPGSFCQYFWPLSLYPGMSLLADPVRKLRLCLGRPSKAFLDPTALFKGTCQLCVIGHCCIDPAPSGNWKLKEDQNLNHSPLTFLCHFCLEPCSAMLVGGMNDWVFFIHKLPFLDAFLSQSPPNTTAFLSHSPTRSILFALLKLLAQRHPVAHCRYGYSLWPSLPLDIPTKQTHASFRPIPWSLLLGGSSSLHRHPSHTGYKSPH